MRVCCVCVRLSSYHPPRVRMTDEQVGNEAGDDNDGPPLAWRAVFVRGTDDAVTEGTDVLQPSLDANASLQSIGRERPEVNMEIVPEPRLVAPSTGGATAKAANRVPSAFACALVCLG